MATLHKNSVKKYKFKLINSIISLAAIGSMWLVWYIVCVATDDGYVVPTIGKTLQRMGDLLFGGLAGTFWYAFGMTLWRTFQAWLISCAVAALLAVASVAARPASAFLRPYVAVLRTLPVMAVTLMLLIWSSKEQAPVIVSALTVCPLTYAQFMAAYQSVDGGLKDMARVYNLSRTDKIFKIYLPQMLPSVLAQAGANISLSLKVIVSAEVLISTPNAIGILINDANMFLDTALMFALTITVLVAGGLIEWLFSNLKYITARWQGGEGADAH